MSITIETTIKYKQSTIYEQSKSKKHKNWTNSRARLTKPQNLNGRVKKDFEVGD